MAKLLELNIDNQSHDEELEQYGSRLCLRIDGLPTVTDESSDERLYFTKSVFI